MEKIIKYVKDNKSLCIMLGITLTMFAVLAILVELGCLDYIDSLVHSYIISIRSSRLTSIFTVITNFAGASFLLACSVLLLIFMKNKKNALYILINLTLAFLANETVKAIFTRPRPIGIHLLEETGFSFPSGHTMVSLSFYGFIVYRLLKNMKKTTNKLILILGLIIFILLIGFSRIYLGVHYMSDVIGGIILSIIYLIIYINIILKLEKK